MDNVPGTEQPPEEMTSPIPLNSLDFPPLPARPETLIISSNPLTSMTRTVLTRVSSKKRHMKDEEEQESDDDSLLSPHNSEGRDSCISSTSPVKKSRKLLSYRDPPPVLQSLDAEAFKNLFESPTLSDSQNSESGHWSSSWSSPRASNNNPSHDNLSSLGDIIQKYSVATLDSMKGFEMPDNYQFDSTLTSPESKQNLSTGTIGDQPILYNTAKNYGLINVPITTALLSLSSDSLGPAGFSHDENDNQVEQSLFMSNMINNNNVSDITSLNLTLPDKSTEPASSEEFINSSIECSKPNSLDTYSNETTDNENESSQPQDDKAKADVSHDGSSEESDGEDEESDDYTESELFESNLQEYEKCKRNKNHLNFYSIPELQIKDLPEEIRHEDSVIFLSCLSQLVVQITVHSTSAARGPNDMYSNYIGTCKKRFGSGFVASVDEDIRKYRCRRADCPYEELNSSFDDNGSMTSPSLNRSVSSASTSFDRSISNLSTASSNSGGRAPKHCFYSGVRIHTNKHIIFDKSEAENAYIKFFYNTPEQKEVVHGHVAAIVGVNNNQDHVVLHVMTHEKSLFTTLGMCLHKAKSSYTQMLQSTGRIPQTLSPRQSWVAIVAHPHGLTKNITFGHIVHEKTEHTRVTKYYDAPTCPGSSGGLVITPSLLRLQWPGAVHSCCDREIGYTFDSRFPDLDPQDMGRINKSILSRKQSYSDDIFNLS